MNDAAPQPDNSPVTGKTGRILREAREAKGLSVREVADSLHLRPSIVTAIEEGDYRQIPGELFLRGYVKSYARHMELDEDSLLSSLDVELDVFRETQEKVQPEHPLEQIERAKGRRRKWARGLVVILFLVAAGLVFMEFSGRSHLFSPKAPETAPTSQPAPAGGDQSPTPPAKSSPDTANSTASTSPSVAPQTSAPLTSEAPAKPPEQTAKAQAGSSGEETQAAATPPASSPAVTSPAPSVASETPSANAKTLDNTKGKPEPAPGPVDTLNATFSGDCWVEITNGDGNRVVAALKRSGDMLHYAGRGPLKIVLGAVNQVSSLSFNGQSVDLGKYPAPGHRAEFVLGK